MGVRSPLREAGLSKADIRALSRRYGLPTWNKPAMACLASRFPYDTPITSEALVRVERAEEVLRALGFGQLRVRHHDTVARIEILPDEIARLVRPAVREKIVAALRKAGYTYVTLDLSGYRAGSMNDVADKKNPGRKRFLRTVSARERNSAAEGGGLTLFRLLLGDNGDVLDAGPADLVIEARIRIGQAAVLQVAVDLDVELFIGHGQKRFLNHRLEAVGIGDLFLIEVHRPVLPDIEDDFRVVGHGDRVQSRGQFQIHALLDQGRDDHEDDQQDEQNVAQGNDVGLSDDLFIPLAE
jgi:hypothetical protein